jgi:hypothetical protein
VAAAAVAAPMVVTVAAIEELNCSLIHATKIPPTQRHNQHVSARLE